MEGKTFVINEQDMIQMPETTMQRIGGLDELLEAMSSSKGETRTREETQFENGVDVEAGEKKSNECKIYLTNAIKVFSSSCGQER